MTLVVSLWVRHPRGIQNISDIYYVDVFTHNLCIIVMKCKSVTKSDGRWRQGQVLTIVVSLRCASGSCLSHIIELQQSEHW